MTRAKLACRKGGCGPRLSTRATSSGAASTMAWSSVSSTTHLRSRSFSSSAKDDLCVSDDGMRRAEGVGRKGGIVEAVAQSGGETCVGTNVVQ
jgi:hypothetical protein